MTITKTNISDVVTIDPNVFEDGRGFFTRVFAKEVLKKEKIHFPIVHVNKSFTKQKGTIRGLHYQIPPHQEQKIVQCHQGAIFDVALDIRRNSKTFGRWVGEVLSAENKRMLYIPKGFAHGFQTLEPNCLVEYFVSDYYAPDLERGIRWNDPLFALEWPIPKATLSEKDSMWPFFIKT
jgi:dTDP-4-dehydrorhamnose 3,5-epimerase